MLIDKSDFWLVDTIEPRISLIETNHALFIQAIDNDITLNIRIEGNFILTVGSNRLRLDAEYLSNIKLINELISLNINNVKVYKNGLLQIEVSNQYVLQVSPDENYEAWEVSSNNGLRVVCMPEGKLSIWSPS